MENTKIKRDVVASYGAFIAVVVGACIALVLLEGKDKAMEIMQNCPMLTIDVVLMAALIGGILVQVISAEDYTIASVFRVERHKFYCKRIKLLRLCQSVAIAIAIAFKVFAMFGSKQMEGNSMGENILYWVIVGGFYASGISAITLLLDLFSAVPAVMTIFGVPFALLMMTVMGVRVPLVMPNHLLEPAILAVASFVAAIYLRKIHKIHFEKIEC